ncbi:receptor kinase-like protein Xa21 isoform X2 [Carya illinoinensis]|uniref:Protein kinase domain-containing protein n=1 Tax=Carya illinoinensis TaxID=32201 RepID=A0A922DWI0_CARIL|nr:receptor kinase-like protein Xa21 isoform X2 [Carya illinoinensis]KAG6692155.1 hypothetical protein I3842_10G099400 [Carya illinoinensis]
MADPTSFLFLLSMTLLLQQSYPFSFANAEILNVTTDKSALFELKAHISSKDSHHVLISNWSSNTHICTWVGVTCGSKHLRVKALNLSYMDLIGTIPPHIGNLSFLVSLSIGNNSFHGSLPNELSRLYRLQFLDLSYNEFSGEIPAWMGLLNKLQILFLHGNNFEGSIPQSLSNISSLQWIDLSYNQLSGSIPSSLFKMPTLQQIVLRSNKLSGPITSIFFNASSLQYIHLGHNKLSGGLPTYMFDLLPNLQYLSISQNHFSGVLPEIGNLTMLRELILYDNNFEGTIPSSLLKCTQLQYLDMWNNNFTGRLSPEIGNLTMLTYLYLAQNKFEGAIPSQIGNLQKLELFAADINYLSGPIPYEIFNISTLQKISMVSNNLSGHLPSSTGSLFVPNIQILTLGDNELSGRIPNSILNASQLIMLDLSHNSFSGSIPEAIGNLRFLEVLNLVSNKLTISFSELRSLFSSLSSCKHLRFLSLSKNHLNDVLPNSVGNLSTSLQRLHLYYCNIKGNIPEEIGNLSSLIDLSLHHNELGGPVPTTIGRLHMLQDEDMVGHVADFGIAKLLGDGVSLTQTMTLATIGYMAPEYGSEGIVSTRGDVYSYGILLMETFTRKKPTDDMFTGDMSLKCLVQESLALSVLEVVDTNLLSNQNDYPAMEECLLSTMGLALHCCADSSEQRIGIENVLATLDKIKLKFLKDITGH